MSDEAILTLDLFVREGRDWYEAELAVESLVEPVKVFVSPGDLDVVELKTTFSSDIRLSHSLEEDLHLVLAGMQCNS